MLVKITFLHVFLGSVRHLAIQCSGWEGGSERWSKIRYSNNTEKDEKSTDAESHSFNSLHQAIFPVQRESDEKKINIK